MKSAVAGAGGGLDEDAHVANFLPTLLLKCLRILLASVEPARDLTVRVSVSASVSVMHSEGRTRIRATAQREQYTV